MTARVRGTALANVRMDSFASVSPVKNKWDTVYRASRTQTMLFGEDILGYSDEKVSTVVSEDDMQTILQACDFACRHPPKHESYNETPEQIAILLILDVSYNVRPPAFGGPMGAILAEAKNLRGKTPLTRPTLLETQIAVSEEAEGKQHSSEYYGLLWKELLLLMGATVVESGTVEDRLVFHDPHATGAYGNTRPPDIYRPNEVVTFANGEVAKLDLAEAHNYKGTPYRGDIKQLEEELAMHRKRCIRRIIRTPELVRLAANHVRKLRAEQHLKHSGSLL